MPRLALLLAILGVLAAAEAPVFRAEGLSVSLRLPISEGTGMPQPDHRLTLIADWPRGGATLRLAEPRFAPVGTDSGERLGLLCRPGNRIQNVALDRQAGRERLLRLSLDLTPPRGLVRSLLDINGTVEVVSGVGAPRTTVVTVDPVPIAGVVVEGLPGVNLRCEDLRENRIALILPAALAERCARITFTDAAGATAAIKPAQPRQLDGGSQRLTFDLAATGARQAQIVWYPETATTSVTVAIPRLDILGGIPGLGDASTTPPVPPTAPAAPKAPFLRAVHDGDAATVSRLLAADPRLMETAEGDGRRPLHRAAAMRRGAVLSALLAAGADPAARAKDGMLPIDLAITAGDPAGVRLLLDHGADLKAVHPTTGWSLLQRAVAAGSPELVGLLLERGADPFIQAKDGRNALDLARDQARWALLRRMLGNR